MLFINLNNYYRVTSVYTVLIYHVLLYHADTYTTALFYTIILVSFLNNRKNETSVALKLVKMYSYIYNI